MIEDGHCLALTKREASETGEKMSLDEQVLVIAFVAIALNLLIWPGRRKWSKWWTSFIEKTRSNVTVAASCVRARAGSAGPEGRRKR
jgi:hypothetical protein